MVYPAHVLIVEAGARQPGVDQQLGHGVDRYIGHAADSSHAGPLAEHGEDLNAHVAGQPVHRPYNIRPFLISKHFIQLRLVLNYTFL